MTRFVGESIRPREECKVEEIAGKDADLSGRMGRAWAPVAVREWKETSRRHRKKWCRWTRFHEAIVKK